MQQLETSIRSARVIFHIELIDCPILPDQQNRGAQRVLNPLLDF